MTASVPSMIGQFNMNNLHILLDFGYEVHIGCNFKDRSIWDNDRTKRFYDEIVTLGIKCHQIDFSRNPINIYTDYKSYTQIEKILSKTKFEFIHCHTPTAGVITRIAAKTKGIKTIYTAHGFHFYKGAPLKNWLLYFPIEWVLSFFTDVLITINKEDYTRAKKYMKAKKVEYVPGVGIDRDKYSCNVLTSKEKEKIRCSLGVNDDDTMLLSIGELSTRKNHEAVIKAIHKLNNKKIKYYICGQGDLKKYLQSLINKFNLKNNVKLLGFRTDINELCCCADLFIFPSLQEGLPVALMEAMASGLPCVVSDIRGNTDLIDDGKGGFLCKPNDVNGFAQKIKMLLSDRDLSTSMSVYNINKLKKYDISAINIQMKKIYQKAAKN